MNPSRNLHILVVDDEVSVRFSIYFALKQSGHHVVMACNGEEALAKIATSAQRFDAVITDNNMPRISGVELVARLRSSRFHGEIFVLSAHLSRENREAYGALGVDMMMPKPFDIFELRQAIDLIAPPRPSTPSHP